MDERSVGSWLGVFAFVVSFVLLGGLFAYTGTPETDSPTPVPTPEWKYEVTVDGVSYICMHYVVHKHRITLVDVKGYSKNITIRNYADYEVDTIGEER